MIFRVDLLGIFIKGMRIYRLRILLKLKCSSVLMLGKVEGKQKQGLPCTRWLGGILRDTDKCQGELTEPVINRS